jgi:hypothetical protein
MRWVMAQEERKVGRFEDGSRPTTTEPSTFLSSGLGEIRMRGGVDHVRSTPTQNEFAVQDGGLRQKPRNARNRARGFVDAEE